MNILLVEPNYRSTFPPLGLLRISSYFKSIGESPTFVRGLDRSMQLKAWDKIFISSLFTFELPRTVKTVNYYQNCVKNPKTDIIVGGVGATLMPEYILENAQCKVHVGPLSDPDMLGFNEPAIANFMPDYEILNTIEKKYIPNDAYFTRVTIGCIRKCAFCAVPVLESKFRYQQNLRDQIAEVDSMYGKKHDLVVLDNNILALDDIASVLEEIKSLGFHKGAMLNGRKRIVDFNQGIDVRLITPEVAKQLSEIAIHPVRIAFDHVSVEKAYREGVRLLAENGLRNIMTYVMFNFNDSPEEFYRRLEINLELSKQYNVRISGFPMRYCPISDVDRHYISPNWNWRYLRGIQCILNATHGVVSPNPSFFNVSFGRSVDEFKEIVTMPDRFIIYRKEFSEEAREWKKDFSRLNSSQQSELLNILAESHNQKTFPHSLDLKINKVLSYY